ncbi:MAG: hypothetical protein ABI345_12230 [Jatrophihabitans sp.]
MSKEPTSKKVRGRALVAAEDDRASATEDAQMEYSETVHKARDHFEAELAEATAHLIERVTPAHRAYNATVISVEHEAEGKEV